LLSGFPYSQGCAAQERQKTLLSSAFKSLGVNGGGCHGGKLPFQEGFVNEVALFKGKSDLLCEGTAIASTSEPDALTAKSSPNSKSLGRAGYL